MLIKAAINGGRTKAEHAATPVSPEEQAADVVECLKAGAGAVHLHVRVTSGSTKGGRQDVCAPSEKESLYAEDVARTIVTVRAAAPSASVGVSTGAWILSHPARLQAVAAWEVLPDFASVNFGEEGAVELAQLLLLRGVDVEAGLCDAADAEVFLKSGLAEQDPDEASAPGSESSAPGRRAARIIRVLLEPQEQEMSRARETVNAIEKVLGGRAPDLQHVPLPPPLLHGTEDTAWPMLDEAIARGYDVRIGLEDTLVLPDGRMAQDNAELVTEAVRRGERREQA